MSKKEAAMGSSLSQRCEQNFAGAEARKVFVGEARLRTNEKTPATLSYLCE